MKRVLVRSVYDAFDYVMEHYYPAGLMEAAERSDSYAVISIQDTHTGGFGFRFTESETCAGALTLYFDDVVRQVEGAVAFDRKMAGEVIDFIEQHREAADTLLVHCYGGQSRSMAVGAFAVRMLGGDNSKYFAKANPNRLVYETLVKEWESRK